jgi:hypothetical protein
LQKKLRSKLKMGFNPTLCPDCNYPPKFILTALPKEDYEDNKQRYSVRCGDCDDFWVEIDEEES